MRTAPEFGVEELVIRVLQSEIGRHAAGVPDVRQPRRGTRRDHGRLLLAARLPAPGVLAQRVGGVAERDYTSLKCHAAWAYA
jgi:hypothetical protein